VGHVFISINIMSNCISS